MGNSYHSLTAAVDHATLLRWTRHQDRDVLLREATAAFMTCSQRDWLMSEISAARTYLQLTSLEWLATSTEAPARTTEHQDSSGYWWFVWVLYRDDLDDAIAGLDAILGLVREQPQRFDANAQEVSAAFAWDRQAAATDDFDVPDGGDGTDPMYVLCTILAFRRLLGLARAQKLAVVHMSYSYRR